MNVLSNPPGLDCICSITASTASAYISLTLSAVHCLWEGQRGVGRGTRGKVGREERGKREGRQKKGERRERAVMQSAIVSCDPL